MNAIQAFVPPDVVRTFSAFLEFCYIARRNIISDDSLEKLNIALHKFHESRRVFLGTVREDSPSGFSLPRQHSMVHYHDHIKNFGSPNGLCSSIMESKHITAVKRPWRRSNKHLALPQMLRVNERLDKLAAARTDFTARGMLADSCLLDAIKNALREQVEDPMDEDASDSNESDSDTSSEIYPFSTNSSDIHDPANTGSFDDTDDNIFSGTGGNTDILNGADADVPNNTDTNANACDDANTDTSNDAGMEDDDYGPVESGPLMNEVRFMSKKG